MRHRSSAIVILAAVALVTSALPVGARSGGAPGRAAERVLLEQLAPDRQVTRDRLTGDVRAIRGGRGPLASARTLGDPATPTRAARAFLDRFGSLVGIAAPGRQLRLARVDRTGRTGTYVRYQQQIDGVPVLGGDLVVAVDGRMSVQAVRGETTHDTDVSTRPTISPGVAMRRAREAVARATGRSVGRLRADPPSRWILDPRLLDAPGLPYARLVWRTEVTDATGLVDWFVAVDARTGDVALRFDQLPAGIPDTAPQRICDQQGHRESESGWDTLPCGPGNARVVADPSSGDALFAKQATEATYDLYRLRFGLDLAARLGGAGGTLVSSVRFCPSAAGGSCPYPNAFWSGSQMVYGTGFAKADDVIGHELTHGVTERASNLFYYMQSGAINEALSDIFGESVDLTNDFTFDTDTESSRWKIGEDVASLGVIRNMKDPTLYGDPDRVDSPLWDDDPDETDQGGVHANSGVANKAFYLMVEGLATPLDPDRDIALDQALAIWYLASSTLLTSASDYEDLGASLLIACDALAGVPGAVKRASGADSTDIEASDCATNGAVQVALRTTHMRWDDRVDVTKPAPLCDDPDATPDILLDDPIDEAGTGWTFDSSAGRRWTVWDAYGYPAAAGLPPYHLFGADLSSTADRRIRRTNAITIPAGPRPVFLHFRHAYGFDDGSEDLDPSDRLYDGGVVEVSADGGPWMDITPLYTDGGPTGRIFAGDTNPLKGRLAFGAESGGYVTARIALSGYPGLSFAGKDVKLSFRLGTDGSYGGEGWFIDDVMIYRCVNDANPDAPFVGPIEVGQQGGTLTPDGRLAVFLRSQVAGGTGPLVVTASVATGAGSFKAVGGTIAGDSHPSVSVLLPTGAAVQHLRITAVDENGDATSSSRDVHATLLQETAMTSTGTWSTRSVAGSSGGTVRASTKPGSSARIVTTAEDIAVIGRMGPDMGRIKMCFPDTTCFIRNLYAPVSKPRQIIAWLDGSSTDATSLKVTLLSTKDPRSSGRRVEIDAVVLIGD